MNQICYKWTSFKTEKKTTYLFLNVNELSLSISDKEETKANKRMKMVLPLSISSLLTIKCSLTAFSNQ